MKALEAALAQSFDREALRATTAPYSVEAFCEAHKVAFEELLGMTEDGGEFEPQRRKERKDFLMDGMQGTEENGNAGIAEEETPEVSEVRVKTSPPQERGTGSTRGIYVVGFGDPARKCALKLMQNIKAHMPDIPICLCAAGKIGPEDVLVTQPDSDVGGRRAKLKAYELARRNGRRCCTWMRTRRSSRRSISIFSGSRTGGNL